MTAFTLNSPDIAAGSTIAQVFEFDGFGCSGKNQSPVLRWSGAPEGTKSFAVNVYDPDAPTGSGFWHWYVIDIPAGVTELAADAGNGSPDGLPEGAITLPNEARSERFIGAGPPPTTGTHRYFFVVDALDVGHALGQVGGHVGGQLQAQLQHRAGHVGEQFLVLLRCADQVATRMGQAQRQKRQGQQHHQTSGRDLGHAQAGGGWGGLALDPAQPRCKPARERPGEQKAQAHTQQAGQQAAPHHQQQRSGHQQIAGHHDALVHGARRQGGGRGLSRR